MEVCIVVLKTLHNTIIDPNYLFAGGKEWSLSMTINLRISLKTSDKKFVSQSVRIESGVPYVHIHISFQKVLCYSPIISSD